MKAILKNKFTTEEILTFNDIKNVTDGVGGQIIIQQEGVSTLLSICLDEILEMIENE